MVREVTICTFAVEQFSKLLVLLEIEGGLCLSQASQLTAIPTMPCASALLHGEPQVTPTLPYREIAPTSNHGQMHVSRISHQVYNSNKLIQAMQPNFCIESKWHMVHKLTCHTSRTMVQNNLQYLIQ